MLSNMMSLFRYRALLQALVVRHLSARYRGSVLGFLWSFLNPLCLMMVYWLVFKYYIRFQQVENYTVFMFSGLLPWIWFSSGVSEGTSAIVSSGHLITKSMFPPLILPAVAVSTTMINFFLSIPILVVLMLITGAAFHWTIILIPVVALLQVVFMFGLTLALSAMNVIFRDIQHLVASLLTFIFFLCPVIYPVESVPEKFRWTVDLNPLALLIQFYQDLILKGTLPQGLPLLYTALWSLLTLILGIGVYDRYREGFAELL